MSPHIPLIKEKNFLSSLGDIGILIFMYSIIAIIIAYICIRISKIYFKKGDKINLLLNSIILTQVIFVVSFLIGIYFLGQSFLFVSGGIMRLNFFNILFVLILSKKLIYQDTENKNGSITIKEIYKIVLCFITSVPILILEII